MVKLTPSSLAARPSTISHTSLLSATRPSTTTASSASSPTGQVRHATYVRRPRRPYTFTQLIQLSDGSSYVARTTSPQPLYRTGKDSRNTLLWQPSESKLRNVEVDEAGKLAAFRERFGRAFDQKADPADAAAAAQAAGKDPKAAAAQAAQAEAEDDGYGDLISSYAPDMSASMKDGASAAAPPGKKRK